MRLLEPSEKYLKKTMPFNRAAAHLLGPARRNPAGRLEQAMDLVGEVCKRFGAWDLLVADQPRPRHGCGGRRAFSRLPIALEVSRDDGRGGAPEPNR